MKYIVNLMRYFYNYFYHQIIAITFFSLMCIYYIICLFNRYYIELDVCLNNIIERKYDSGYFVESESNSYSSLAQIGIINENIYKKNYTKAIYLIDQFKKDISKQTRLYHMLTVRQAMLHMNCSEDIEKYSCHLESKYGELSPKIRNYLLSIYQKHYSELL